MAQLQSIVDKDELWRLANLPSPAKKKKKAAEG
jgi:hypothetical protein